jgi:hypothetical protein
MRRAREVMFAVWVATLAAPGFVSAQTDVERARLHYNSGELDESIAAAAAARARSASAASATLIEARARLERFRQKADPADLAAARADLVALNPATLSAQEAIEWQIGLGTALFLEQQLGPAAEMFARILPSARERLPPSEVDKLFEWWASTMSRMAEGLAPAARRDAYATIAAAVRDELTRNPLSRPATYWAVVAARGIGDLEVAWNGAIAGWIRAGSFAGGADLRADLERFVMQTLIPERAQARTGERLDSKLTVGEIASLTEVWREIIGRWKPKG